MREEITTETEDMAIAADAIQGRRKMLRGVSTPKMYRENQFVNHLNAGTEISIDLLSFL